MQRDAPRNSFWGGGKDTCVRRVLCFLIVHAPLSFSLSALSVKALLIYVGKLLD